MKTLPMLAGARTQTDKLFDLVREDALYDRPIPERHRIAFYLGHLEAFDWNLLRPHATNLPRTWRSTCGIPTRCR